MYTTPSSTHATAAHSAQRVPRLSHTTPPPDTKAHAFFHATPTYPLYNKGVPPHRVRPPKDCKHFIFHIQNRFATPPQATLTAPKIATANHRQARLRHPQTRLGKAKKKTLKSIKLHTTRKTIRFAKPNHTFYKAKRYLSPHRHPMPICHSYANAHQTALRQPPTHCFLPTDSGNADLQKRPQQPARVARKPFTHALSATPARNLTIRQRPSQPMKP